MEDLPVVVRMPQERFTFVRLAWAVCLVGGIIRLVLIVTGHPRTDVDTALYADAASKILSLNFRGLDGMRLPGYPLLLAVCGLNWWAVWVLQSLLGLAASVLILDMALRRTRAAAFSLAVALACSLIPNLLLYESNILSETLTSFLLVASVWILMRGEEILGSRIRSVLGMGIVSTLLGLTHPLMLSLIPIQFYFVVSAWFPFRSLRRELIKGALVFSAPVIILIGGWCTFNYVNNGVFTPTNFAGHNLMRQASAYMDLAPERFASIKQFWKGDPDQFEEMQLTRQERAQFVRQSVSLALYLYFHHPLLCLVRAEEGWMLFWETAGPEQVDWSDNGRIGIAPLLRSPAKFLCDEITSVFLVLALMALPCAVFHLRIFSKEENFTFAIAMWASVFAAFTEYGQNHRYLYPFLRLILYTVLVAGWRCVTALSAKNQWPADRLESSSRDQAGHAKRKPEKSL